MVPRGNPPKHVIDCFKENDVALSIGVKEGSKIKIGRSLLTVLIVRTPLDIDVRVDASTHRITDQESTVILPDVTVFAGKWNGKGSQSYGRLAFNAPRSIRIERIPVEELG